MINPPNIKERYKKIAEALENIKKNLSETGQIPNIHALLVDILSQISKINPFASIIIDIYAEAEELKRNPSLLNDSMKRNMMMMKLDFWKEKLMNSADLIDI